MKRLFFGFFAGFVLGLGICKLISYSFQARNSVQVESDEALLAVRDIFKVSLLEIALSQVFEVEKDHIRLADIPIPLTQKKSLIAVRGLAMLGYDAEKAKVVWLEKAREVRIRLPDVTLVSTDLQFRFIFEKDSFLNRISVEDRTEFLEKLREAVRAELLQQDRKKWVRERFEKQVKNLERNLKIRVVLEKEKSS